MKKTSAIFVAIVFLCLLVGCGDSVSTEVEGYAVMNAWSGEFSKTKLTSTIIEYRSEHGNIIPKAGDKSLVSFDVDFEIASCEVSRLSPVDDTDINVEMNGYIDRYVNIEAKDRTVTVPIDWRDSGQNGFVWEFPIWSYLISVTDTQNTRHFYYFRVDYSANC